MLPLAQARANRAQVDWRCYLPTAPKFIGRRVFRNFDLAEIARYIDWAPFFHTWELAGSYPKDRERLIREVDAALDAAARHPGFLDGVPEYGEEYC